MKFNITLTWSKVMALLVLIGSLLLDIRAGGSSAFMFALPFIVFLITGKQVIDLKKRETGSV